MHTTRASSGRVGLLALQQPSCRGRLIDIDIDMVWVSVLRALVLVLWVSALASLPAWGVGLACVLAWLLCAARVCVAQVKLEATLVAPATCPAGLDTTTDPTLEQWGYQGAHGTRGRYRIINDLAANKIIEAR
eukprot:COSAG02_NODE_6112_length_3791_cov_2.780065_4_plen_132_part_01